MSSIAERPGRTLSAGNAFRALGAILVGALLIAAANTDIPSPLPWAFGLLPVALLWLARKVGLLLGTLAAASTLGALYASGIHETHQLVFIGVLAASGLLLAACARRGLSASVTASLAAALVLAVAGGYLLAGGMDELSRLLAARIDELKRLETEHRLSQSLGLSSTEFLNALDQTGRLWALLLPSLFALKWIAVIATNCWLASVLFQDEEGGGFPAFSDFSIWRIHPIGAWVLALAMLLMVTQWKPAFEAGVNLAFPLALAYTVQGFAVSRYVAQSFHIRGLVQAAVLVLLVLMPILITTVTAVGLLDVWYDFRLRATPDPDAGFGGRGSSD
ncbi:MAG TPA: DUF2232 domain-containing protein [Candidatus Polarisedimenticolia bacterium]|nr:DUF2232 domain-containing protein [Candidatus Polarisedimenticolia bacterium]